MFKEKFLLSIVGILIIVILFLVLAPFGSALLASPEDYVMLSAVDEAGNPISGWHEFYIKNQSGMSIVLGPIDKDPFRVDNSLLKNIDVRAFNLEKGQNYIISVSENETPNGLMRGSVSIIYTQIGQNIQISNISPIIPQFALENLKKRYPQGFMLETPGIQ